MTLAKRGYDNLAVIPGQIKEEPLSQRDYEALKSALPKYRDILFAKMLRGTGIRIAEALAITPVKFKEEGFDFHILVRRGKKRDKDQTPVYEKIYLNPQLGVELRDYIKGLGIHVDQRVFKITARRVEQIFKEAGNAAIGRPIHPHELRHLYITSTVDNVTINGRPITMEEVAKMVGHEDPSTTRKVYYDLTSEKRAEIQRRIPV